MPAGPTHTPHSQDPLSRGSDDGHSDSDKSAQSTQHAVQEPSALTPLKEHVQQAFNRFKRTVGASKKEISKAGTNFMGSETCAGLEQMSIPPTAENYVLGSKALKVTAREAKMGVVGDDMVYWRMAVMYALNPTELHYFANPTAAECDKVRALILNEHRIG